MYSCVLYCRTFEECDLEHCGRLHYEEFRMFVSRNPAIVDYFEDIMPYSGHKDTGPRGHPMMAGTHTHSRSKKEVLPHRKLHRASSTMKDDIGGVGSPRFRGSSKYNSFSPDIEASVGGAPLSRGSSISASPMGDDTSLNLFTKNDLNRAMNRMNSMAIQKQYSEDEGVGIASAADIGNLEKHDSEQVIQVRRNPNAKSSTNLTAEAVQGFSNSKKAESTQDDTLHQNDSNFESEVLTYMLLERAMNTTKNEDLQRVIREVIDHIPGFNRSMVGDANAGTGENLTYHVPMYGNYNPFAENEKTEENEAEISMEGFLWKKGKFLHLWSKRWYILSGNCIYYYDSNNKDDMALKGVVFLTGCLVSELHDVDNEVKGYFGFELTHQDLTAGENHKHERRTFYCESEENRALWINKLQHAAQVVPIEDDYVIGAELGKGRFSIVYDCVHIRTKEHCAVKVIDKTTIEAEDRGLLRTEIAVLKIVDHPNIIKMCGIYESKKYIYIVMEKLSGGELFERIVGRPRFTEVEAAKLIVPLLEAVAYLHDLGIAHRDLKPENILCSEGKVDDIKIADFGLSKMVLPEEKMMGACGTLSYVAPEVLSMQGYGVQADVWSVGVILFLILCGKLPFDGDDSNDIIRKTVQCEPSVNPNVWNKFSDDTKNILSCMLKKDPSKRITARECLKHPFIVINCAAPSPAVPGGVSAPASNANA